MGVERDRDGVLTWVTFTTEVPEYFDHLAARDEARLLATYHELVGPHVKAEELVVGGPTGATTSTTRRRRAGPRT